MALEDQTCDDILKVKVKNNEYFVSKKLICSRVPYFDKMFSSELLKPKENKVELDFDKSVFISILTWIHTQSLSVNMNLVIQLYDAAHLLMLNDKFLKNCSIYFHDNFMIEHIPMVLQQVTKTTKLISSEAITNIICRYFLIMSTSQMLLECPSETFEAILKMDLMVHSEYQIFDVIMNWVEKDPESRDESLERLFKCIHWSALDLKDSKVLSCCRDFYSLDYAAVKKYFKYFYSKFVLPSFLQPEDSYRDDFTELFKHRSSILAHLDYKFPRSKQNFFISLLQKGDENLRINVYDDYFYCLPFGDLTCDNSVSLQFAQNGLYSDILFNSGTKGVRVDWIEKTFKWLDFKVKGKTYYNQLMKFMVKFPKYGPFTSGIE